MIAAETFVQPVNQSAIFLKEKDVNLPAGSWQIAIDVTLMPFEDVLTNIKGDLLEIREHKQEFTSISELSQKYCWVGNLRIKTISF